MLDSFRSSFLTFAESYETKKNLYNTVRNKLIYSIPVVVIVINSNYCPRYVILKDRIILFMEFRFFEFLQEFLIDP